MGRKQQKRVAAREDDSDSDEPQRKKRGQASDFTGQRLAFLTENIPDYIAASKKKLGPEAKTEGLATFWPKFFNTYWTRFPWDLPFDQDPSAPAPSQTAVDVPADDAPAVLGQNLTSEQMEAKTRIQKDMKAVRSPPQKFIGA
jgi:hypothetical protein